MLHNRQPFGFTTNIGHHEKNEKYKKMLGKITT